MSKLKTALGLSILTSLLGCQKPLEVREAHLLYSDNPMISRGYFSCTAVVVDYGNSAVLAHAWPPLAPNANYYGAFEKHGILDNNPITVDNVVEMVEKEAEENGETSKGVAYIYGPERYTSLIYDDFSEKNIPVTNLRTKEELHISDCADVFYNPESNELKIIEDPDCYLGGRQY